MSEQQWEPIKIEGINDEEGGQLLTQDSDLRAIALDLSAEVPLEWGRLLGKAYTLKGGRPDWNIGTGNRQIILYANLEVFSQDDLNAVKAAVEQANEEYKQYLGSGLEEAARDRLRQLADKLDFSA